MTDTNKMRKLLAAATPLPWIVQKDDYWNWNSWSVTGPAPERVPGWQTREPEAFDDGSAQGNYPATCTDATRDLIVAAVNGLPAMLDELDAARARIAKLEQETPMALVDFGVGVNWKGLHEDMQRLRAERDAARAQLHADDQRAWEALGKPEGTHDTTNVQRLCAEVERLRAELRAVATIAHEGGLAELGEGPPLTAIRRRTLCWWDRTGSRADAYARVRAAMKHKETDQ